MQIGHRLRSRADIRLGDDLDEWDTTAVAVEQRALDRVVDEFAGVFFDVDTGDADAFGTGPGLDIQMAAAAQRQVVLGDLIGFGQVGVKVVFAILFRKAGDLAIQGQTSFDGVGHHLLIEHRQTAGQTGADRAALGVGGGAKGGGTVAEYLGLCFELGVDLQPDDHLVARIHHALSSL